MKQMEKVNEAVGTKNRLTMGGGGKLIVCPFRRHKLWKFIVCVLLEVIYGENGHKLWSEIPKYYGNKEPTKPRRDV